MERFEEIRIPEIEEKKHGKRKAAAGIIIAGIVLFMLIGFFWVKAYYAEERTLIKGILNLAGEMEERQQLWEEASGNSFDDPFGTMKVTTIFNVCSEELPVTLGVDTILLRDADMRMVQASTAVSIMNNQLAELTIVGQDDTLTVSLPAFFRQNLVFDAERIDRQYNESLLAEKFGRLENTELSIELFPEDPRKIWDKYYVNLMESLKDIEADGIREIEIEKLETPLVLTVPEKDDRQYQCSQYRVSIPYHTAGENDRSTFWQEEQGGAGTAADMAEGVEKTDKAALLIAVDDNDRIVQITPEESLSVTMNYKGNDIDVNLTGNVCFLGEERSIDDIVVNMQMELPLEVPEFAEKLLSVFGNGTVDEKDVIAIQAGAEVIYNENDSSVTTDLNKLTVKVDRIGSFKVTGTIVTEPLHEPIKVPEGETIRIFEITQEQYLDLELQIMRRIGRWLKAIGR